MKYLFFTCLNFVGKILKQLNFFCTDPRIIYQLIKLVINPGIEDLENWHGKALGDKGKGFIEDPANSRTTAGSHQITPPANDVAPNDNSPITLSEPPSYKLGEKVKINCICEMAWTVLTFTKFKLWKLYFING